MPFWMPRLLPAAREVNESMPKHVAGLALAAIAENALPDRRDTRIAVLGMAYLEDSDDTRHSPSDQLIQFLRQQGIETVAHDPFVSGYKGDVYECVKGCDAVILMVKHSVYRSISLPRMASLMRMPVLIDGRGFFEPQEAVLAGLIYRGVGR